MSSFILYKITKKLLKTLTQGLIYLMLIVYLIYID